MKQTSIASMSAAELRELRIRAGLSQAELGSWLARRAGLATSVDASSISRWELGRVRVPGWVARACAGANAARELAKLAASRRASEVEACLR